MAPESYSVHVASEIYMRISDRMKVDECCKSGGDDQCMQGVLNHVISDVRMRKEILEVPDVSIELSIDIGQSVWCTGSGGVKRVPSGDVISVWVSSVGSLRAGGCVVNAGGVPRAITRREELPSWHDQKRVLRR